MIDGIIPIVVGAVIRLALSITLLVFAYRETGVAATIILSLVMLALEMLGLEMRLRRSAEKRRQA